MNSPKWDESRHLWVTEVHTNVFDWIDVLISTDGASSLPTARQLSTVDALATLPSALITEVATQARAYAEEYMMDDDFDELSEADFEMRFSTCIIPRLRDTPDHYFFLIGDSDIDEEHGVACLFKNHDACRVCHTDDAYNNWDWDDTAHLDSLLKS